MSIAGLQKIPSFASKHGCLTKCYTGVALFGGCLFVCSV